jgi:hypothetical protein
MIEPEIVCNPGAAARRGFFARIRGRVWSHPRSSPMRVFYLLFLSTLFVFICHFFMEPPHVTYTRYSREPELVVDLGWAHALPVNPLKRHQVQDMANLLREQKSYS